MRLDRAFGMGFGGAGKPAASRAGSPEGGFATATVILLLVISIVGGAYLLKLTRSHASASGGYYQARAAALAAQAGLESALAQLESDPAGGVALLNGYLADADRQWLLGSDGSRTERTMGNGLQRYAVRILAFDPATGVVKLEGQGKGPGGSVSSAFGVYRLGGLALDRPPLAKYAWYMAGEARNVDQPVDVQGDAYFGGGVHFNGGARGSVFRGDVKIARGAGLESNFDDRVTFLGTTYVQTPLKSQGGGLSFAGKAGFESNLFLETDTEWSRTGLDVYTNASIVGGSAKLDVDGNRITHSGSLNTARVANAARITDNHAVLDIATALGMSAGAESELAVDLSAVPARNRFTPSDLGIVRWGTTSGAALSSAYASVLSQGRLYRGYLVVDVGASLNFEAVPGDMLAGKFVFNVTSPVTMNGHLPDSDPASVSLWRIGNGGSVTGFGGTGRFRGYINVSGNAHVIYQWGPGAEFQGAVHHVSATSGFQLNVSGGPLKITFSQGVFDDLAVLGALSRTGAGVPAPPAYPVVKLVDVKIRPAFMGRYF